MNVEDACMKLRNQIDLIPDPQKRGEAVYAWLQLVDLLGTSQVPLIKKRKVNRATPRETGTHSQEGIRTGIKKMESEEAFTGAQEQ